jgi:hypothetical protein
MKKMKLKLAGNETLSKDQMKKIAGGDEPFCGYNPGGSMQTWNCCYIYPSGQVQFAFTAGVMECPEAVAYCGAWGAEPC